MSAARDAVTVPLPADRAFELWTEVTRWATFIDGFGHAESVDDAWPGEGSKVVWRSGPAGRGLVTEKVTASEPGARIATQVYEERLNGTQTVEFTPVDDETTRVDMELDYTLTKPGPFSFITDALFIRRAQTDAIRRTLRRFRVEAAEEVGHQA